VDVAQRAFVYRETTRNLNLLQKALLPKQRQSLEVARSAYLAGQVDFLNLTEAEQTLLRFNLDEVEARTQRELSLAELSLIMQGMPPAGGGATGMEISSPGNGAGKKMGGGAPSGGMGSSSGSAMLPGNSAPPPKQANQGGMGQ
jgi:hypothetical protein